MDCFPSEKQQGKKKIFKSVMGLLVKESISAVLPSLHCKDFQMLLYQSWFNNSVLYCEGVFPHLSRPYILKLKENEKQLIYHSYSVLISLDTVIAVRVLIKSNSLTLSMKQSSLEKQACKKHFTKYLCCRNKQKPKKNGDGRITLKLE